jgi:hypothetical protein
MLLICAHATLRMTSNKAPGTSRETGTSGENRIFGKTDASNLNVSSFKHSSPVNRDIKWLHLAKGTEKFILGRYLLLGILLILPSLRPWEVVARPAILENRGGKSHFCDYFIIRARYVYLSYYKKCRTYNSLHFLLFMFFCQINSFVVTACRNREFLLFLYCNALLDESSLWTGERGHK